jgi:hypothetical protein
LESERVAIEIAGETRQDAQHFCVSEPDTGALSTGFTQIVTAA